MDKPCLVLLASKMINLRYVLELVKHKKIKMVSESQYRQMWEVAGHSVIFQIKKGRRVLTCDCDNHTRFCGTPSICAHKEAVIAFPIIEAMQGQIKKFEDTIKALGLGQDKDFVSSLLFEMEDLVKLGWVRQLKYK